MSDSEQDQGLSPEVRKIAIVVIVGAIMSILDTTIVNVALQTLSNDFSTSISTIQWVATGYLLALATVIPLTGWAAERFGPKRVWIVAVSGFVLTSALCGAAWSVPTLIGFRVLQGLAGGMIMPVGMVTLAQAAGPHRVGRVMSVIGVPMLLAPILGPVIGGVLIDNASWRWIFYVNVPIGAIGLLLAVRLLPAERATGLSTDTKLDWRGLLLGSPGVALAVFGISEYGTQRTVSATSVWLPVVAGVVLLVCFVVNALRTRHPLVDVQLFKGAGFSAAAVTVTLAGIALFGSMILLPLYYQEVRGLSPLQAGLLLMPQGLGAAIAMRVGGRLTDSIGAGPVVLTGLFILTVGTAFFTRVGTDSSYVLLSVGLFLRGLGLGACMMPAMAGAYATLRREQVPRATPMLNVLQRIGGSVGVALLTVILDNGIADHRDGGLGGVAHAFANAYWWSLILIVAAFVPATVLAVVEQRTRAATPGPAEPPGTEAVEQAPRHPAAAGVG